MKPPPFRLDDYRIGDAVAFEPVEAIDPDKLSFFALRKPAGKAWTARKGDGKAVACMGLFNIEGGQRCWALVSKDIGLSGWGHLLRMSMLILHEAGGQIVRAHAASAREARMMAALGFIKEPLANDWPCPMVRFR